MKNTKYRVALKTAACTVHLAADYITTVAREPRIRKNKAVCSVLQHCEARLMTEYRALDALFRQLSK